MTLADAKVGQIVRLSNFKEQSSLTLKLLSLGLLPGDSLVVTSKAPFGGPLAIKHGSSQFFAIRRNEASQINVHTEKNCD